MQRLTTREEWEHLPLNPDLREDLGYDLLDLESYETDDDRILFLPHDEDMIRGDAFIVAKKDIVQEIGH